MPSPAEICLNKKVGGDQKDWTEIALIHCSPGQTEVATGVAETGQATKGVEEDWPILENAPRQDEHCLP